MALEEAFTDNNGGITEIIYRTVLLLGVPIDDDIDGMYHTLDHDSDSDSANKGNFDSQNEQADNYLGQPI
jgi:hypothetical protein